MVFLSGRIIFAGGEDHIAYKFQYYGDNNFCKVVSNDIEFSKTLGSHFNLAGGYLVDAISAASRKDIRGTNGTATGDDNIDARTAATHPFDGVTSASVTDERRHQVSGTLSFIYDFIKLFRSDKNNDDPLTVSVTGINSQENDYTSRTISVALSQDLFQRNTTIGLGYNKSFDQYSPDQRYTPPSGNEGWNFLGVGKRQTEHLSASFTQGLTITTLFSFIADYGYDRGYLSRPYYVYKIGTVYYHENYPSQRKSLAFAGQVNQYLPSKHGTSVQLNYRYYGDTWKLKSQTITLNAYWRFAEKFILSPSYRFYYQTAAFFYQDTYTTVPAYLTVDFKFSTFISNKFGLKLAYELKDFIKPAGGSFFSLYPINIDIAANYVMRSGTNDISIRNSHYSYWPIESGYRNFWVQTGVTFAF